MSQTDTDAPGATGGDIVPPLATIPIPRTGDTVYVDTECTLGEYYVTVWSNRAGDSEPGEFTADNAEDFARCLAAHSAAVRRLNRC